MSNKWFKRASKYFRKNGKPNTEMEGEEEAFVE